MIPFHAGADLPAFLPAVFSKGERVDFSQAERNQLRGELAGLTDDYRKGVRRHVQGR